MFFNFSDFIFSKKYKLVILFPSKFNSSNSDNVSLFKNNKSLSARFKLFKHIFLHLLKFLIFSILATSK